jgi:hypothetical protein
MMKLNLLSKTLTLVLTALLMILGMGGLMAQTQKIDVLTTSGTFTVPCGVTSVKVRAVGGGGGGGVRGNSGGGSAGGGGGAYAEITTYTVTPGKSMTYTVGAGGNGTVNNSPGGITTVTYEGAVILQANGGGGGDNLTAGSGGLAGTLGNVNNAGGTGANGNTANTGKAAGGGGGAGSSVGKGNNATGITGGAASGTYGGKGGDGNDLGIGFAGGNYGGGGGGSVGAAGGNGGSGVVVIEYTLPPTPVITFPATPPVACKDKPFSTTLSTSNVTSIAYSGFPAGLTPALSGNIITISGTTTAAAGNYNYTITANNCATTTFTGTITVAVTAAITQDPLSQSYCAGSPPTLQVAASGTGLTYQWYSATSASSTSGSSLIGGATGASYLVPTSTTELRYYYVVVTGNSACGSPLVSKIATVTRNAPAAIVSGPANATYCVGSAATALSVNATGSGLTYQWYSNTTNSNTGGTAIGTARAATFTPPTTTAGTYFYYVTVTGICGSAVTSAVSTVTVNPATAITTQPTSAGSFCANSVATPLTVEATGFGTLSYQWYSSTDGTTSNSTAISGATSSTYVPSTLTEGTQYYYVTVTGCNTVTSSVATVKVGEQNTWNGSSWSAGTSNMPGYNAVIDADYNTSNGNIVACNCTVNSGKTLAIGANTHITVDKNVVNNGSLIVESDGNLLQKDATVINGTPITVKRNFTLTEGRKEYNFISSPVKGQNMKLIFGSATAIPYVTVYNEATDYFVNAKATDYDIVGRGFSVKEPTKAAVPLNNATATYNGIPNNGNYDLALPFSGQYYGFNVIGNPYPSNIDLTKLYADNTGKIDATFRFWDNTVNNIYAQQGSDYGQSAYATYNAFGGGGIPAPGYNGKSTKTPTNIVKVDQAFMIQALQPAQIVFKNTIRTVDNNSTFFGKQVNLNAFNLELLTPAGIGMQNAFVYSPEVGSTSFGREDSEVYNYYTSDALYSILGDVNVVIDGRGAFSTDDVITLGTAHYNKGTHSIRAIGLQGIFANGQAIYLKDKVTNIITDISKKAYTFEAAEGDSNNRFEILYQTVSLGTDNVVKSGLVVYKEGSSFIVRGGKKMRSVELYDAVGRLVKALPTNSDTMEIAAESMTPGIYVVKVKYDDSTIQTKKVLK